MVGAYITHLIMKKTKKKPTIRDIIQILETLDSVIVSQDNYIKYLNNKIDLVSSTLYGLLEMKEDTEDVMEYIKKRDKEKLDALSKEAKEEGKNLHGKSDNGSEEVPRESV
jgi:hypothetical protein